MLFRSFTQRQLLRFRLRVSDEFSSSEDELTVVVLPPSRPPLVFLDIIPRKPIYQPSDRILLDASFSFSDEGKALEYVWKNLSGLEIFDRNGAVDASLELTDSRLICKIPESITQYTEFIVKLTVTDTGNNRSTVEKILIRVAPPILPPVANINPSALFIQDHIVKEERLIATVDGSGSFSRGGGALSYNWEFDQTLLELNSGSSLNASAIELRAVHQIIADTKTSLRLLVTDQNGVSSSTSIPVLVKKAKPLTRPVELQAFFRREISAITFEENPRLDTISGFSVFSSDTLTESMMVLARAFDPNFESEPATHKLSAVLYSYDKLSKSRGAEISNTILRLIGSDSFSTAAQFALAFNQRPAEGAYVIQLSSTQQSGLSTAYDQLISLYFEIEPEILEPIEADLKIIAVESISQGYESLSTNAYSNSFVDERVRVILEGSFSGRADSHPVEYQYSSNSDNPDIGRLFIANFGSGRAEVLLPVPLAPTTFDLSLVVRDMIKPALVSQASSVKLTIQKVLSLPPVADAGEYPAYVLSQSQSKVVVKLDGRKSYSPVGNPLEFRWTYLGVNSVFGLDTVTSSVVAEASLPEGEHLFELRVTDVRTGLSDNQFVSIVVSKELESIIDYVVEGEVFVPNQIKEGQLASISAKFNVLRVDPDADPVSLSKIYYTLRIDGSPELLQMQGNHFSVSKALTYGTTHSVIIYAYYDANGDDLLGDTNTLMFKRETQIRVNRRVSPLKLNFSLNGEFASQHNLNINNDADFTDNLTTNLSIENPNTSDSWADVNEWTGEII